MSRSVLKLIVCGCALIAAAIAAVPASATAAKLPRSAVAAAAKPPRSAVTSTCGTSTKAAARKITTQVTMRPVSGTQKMMLEMLLQERPAAGGDFTTRPMPAQSDFGFWLTPTPPTLGQNPNDVWNVSKTVTHLVPGYSFRVKVKFRWWGANSKLLKHQTRYTKACKQPAAKSTSAN